MDTQVSTAILRNGWLILAVIVILSLFISVNWYYYSTTKNNLETSLGNRIQAVASSVSSQIGSSLDGLDHFNYLNTPFPTEIINQLEKLEQRHNLSNILIIREDGTTLFSLKPSLYPTGEVYPHWVMDYQAIIQALENKPSSTELYRSPDGDYLKAGYAPLSPAISGIPAVVCVEAGADFLRGLSKLKWIIIATTAVSVLGVVLFIWFILKATTSLIQTREALLRSETLASMGRMAAGIAHEIRNPLFIIRSSAENLKKAHREEAEGIDEFIIEEVDRLNDILTNYLLFSRDEPIKKTNLDLVKTLNRSIKLMSETIEDDNIDTITEIIPDQAPMTGEENKLRQSFLNLMLNAVESLEGDGEIRIGLRCVNNNYIITVKDNGKGIPEDELERIFEPFYTTKEGGSGLGLPIVKSIIERHGGYISIHSQESEGTTVTIELPINSDIRGEEK
jgi:signal transduction histidine kinase